ncbi:MAG: GxxExxY protein [Bacteroidia bacterium]|nr:GxxExxY protein [Bacteroidia bacterium]
MEQELEDIQVLEEAAEVYGLSNLLYKQEVYDVIGVCMEIHRILGKGFNEIVYKDAMELEFKGKGWVFEREKKFEISYKEIVLPHFYFADFVYDNKIILEIKAQQGVVDAHYKQTINYLAASKFKLGLIINFGEDSLKFKRVIL